MAAKGSKVFDVAKPGTSKPNTGSKPMVVGHKTVMTDPTLKDDSETKEAELNEKDAPVTSKKKTIQPLEETKEEKSDNEASAQKSKKQEEPESKSVQEPETVQKQEEKEASKKESEPTKKSDDESEQKPEEADSATDVPEDKSGKTKEIADIQLERENKLNELIKSKKYAVSIKESKSSAVQTFIITFLLVGLVGAVLVLGLIDAEVIDLGVELPFDLL